MVHVFKCACTYFAVMADPMAIQSERYCYGNYMFIYGVLCLYFTVSSQMALRTKFSHQKSKVKCHGYYTFMWVNFSLSFVCLCFEKCEYLVVSCDQRASPWTGLMCWWTKNCNIYEKAHPFPWKMNFKSLGDISFLLYFFFSKNGLKSQTCIGFCVASNHFCE